jgi:MoaA/NifB/PqqE/SkfB family radical SAM enzyme
VNLRGAYIFATKGLARALRNRPVNSSTEIRLTSLCTQRCRQCNIYNKKTDSPTLSLDDFERIARKLRQYGAYIGFISGGEPTLVPHLEQILTVAKRTFPVALTLNTGLYNKTSIIERTAEFVLKNGINIQTSLDGLNEVGDNLRGVSHFSTTILDHMDRIARLKEEMKSPSLLYANIVLNNLNIHQIPEMIDLAAERGWYVTVGLYHTLTASTKKDPELIPRTGQELDRLISDLTKHPKVLTLDSFLRGILPFLRSNGYRKCCPYIDAPVLSSRLLIMENGDVHLCQGESIGNILSQSVQEVFSGDRYRQRLTEYRSCPGCWTSCYVQRFLVLHPGSFRNLLSNVKKMHRTRQGLHARRP